LALALCLVVMKDKRKKREGKLWADFNRDSGLLILIARNWIMVLPTKFSVNFYVVSNFRVLRIKISIYIS
jgi:hypothetical protein